MEHKKVRKAVIAAAGTGTRFLPQTKAMPKEMLPIMGKPIIQWVVEELVAVGITDIIIVTGSQKRALEDHFDRSIEMETKLRNKDKNDLADEIQGIAEMANFVYIRQKTYKTFDYGTAVPLMNARHLIGDEPFYFVSADDLFVNSGDSRAKQMMDAYELTGKSIIAGLEIDKSESKKYGMLEIGEQKNDKVFQLTGLVEKPEPEDAPSNFMTIMWYLLTPDVFPYIDKTQAGIGGELQALDSVNLLAQDDAVYSAILDGTYHDCGNYVSYLKASIHFASQYDDVKKEIQEYMHKHC